MTRTTKPDLRTAGDARVVLCTVEGGGIEHDYRPVTDPDADGPGRARTYLRCVWCHGVACGNADQPDPCIEPYHHSPLPHRTATGVTWPIGGVRP